MNKIVSQTAQILATVFQDAGENEFVKVYNHLTVPGLTQDESITITVKRNKKRVLLSVYTQEAIPA